MILPPVEAAFYCLRAEAGRGKNRLDSGWARIYAFVNDGSLGGRVSKVLPVVEMLKEFYAAINRNDIPAALSFLAPEIERIEPPGFPTSGKYCGLAEVETHLSRGRGTWEEGRCDPERFLAAGDKIVAFLHVRVRLKGKSEWIDARFADGFIFRNGKIVQFRTFVERREALAWAGIDGEL